MKQQQTNSNAGFSLSEVTISVGIVATIMLPLIALLAGSSGSVTQSQDRFSATRIARSIEGQIRYSDAGNQFILEMDPTVAGSIQQRALISPPQPGGTKEIYFGFDSSNRIVRNIEEGEFQSGIPPATEDILYLAKVAISTSNDGFSTLASAPPLYRITISVEQPAFTAAENRSRERLSMLVAGQ